MPTEAACLSPDELERFLLGQSSEQDAVRAEQHLASCTRCLTAAHTMAVEDPLARAVRTHTDVPEPDPQAVDELIRKLRREMPVPSAATPATQTGPDDRTLAPTEPDRVDFLSPPQSADEIGRLGGYRILKKLGAGGMGMVFEAEDPQLRRRVALKVMRPALAANQSARARFEREAQAAAAIEHDHIVAIHQVGSDNGVPFLAMPFLQGESLDDRLHHERRLPIDEVLRIGEEIAEGLAAAHEAGLVHRDIKPANIWLESKGYGSHTGGRVKILDFGLARGGLDDVRLTQSGMIVGTPAFMAPEQGKGEPVDARADLFSLGCVLYLMATGKLPFTGSDAISTLLAIATVDPIPPEKLNPELPAALCQLILRLLAKEPPQRPQSAAVVAETLRAIRAGSTGPAASTVDMPATLPPPARIEPSWRRPAVFGVAVLVGIAAGALIVTRFFPRHEDAQVVQTAAIEARLRERNAGFDEKIDWQMDDGKIVGLSFASDHVVDLSPLQAVPTLKRLACRPGREGKNLVADLSPLQGLPLEELETPSCLTTDFTPLQAMPLRRLDLTSTQLSDLEVMRKMPLEELLIQGTRVASLEPLKGMRLKQLSVARTRVEDLAPLESLPLEVLQVEGSPIRSLAPLRSLATLTRLSGDVRNEADAEVLRSLPKLTEINGKSPAAFWKEYVEPTPLGNVDHRLLTARATTVGHVSLRHLRSRLDPELWRRLLAIPREDGIAWDHLLKTADRVDFSDYFLASKAELHYLAAFNFVEPIKLTDVIKAPLPEPVKFVNKSSYYMVAGRAYWLASPKRLVIGDEEQVRSYMNRTLINGDTWKPYSPSPELLAVLKTIDRKRPVWIASAQPTLRGRAPAAPPVRDPVRLLRPFLGDAALACKDGKTAAMQADQARLLVTCTFENGGRAIDAEKTLGKAFTGKNRPAPTAIVGDPALAWLRDGTRLTRSGREVWLTLPLVPAK
jgi:tRNA A-37 threonylcarbamoyl transferase component Bud32